MQLAEKEFDISFFKRLFGRSGAEHKSIKKKLPKVSQEQRVEVLKALADETRLSIVQKLAHENSETAGCDILSCPSVRALSQPAMSHHFGKLVDAGVITETKQGTQKLYELNCALLEAVGLQVRNL